MQYEHHNSIVTDIRYNTLSLYYKDSRRTSHWHEYFEIVIVEKGSARFYLECGAEPFTFHAGDMILLFPNIFHFPCCVDGAENTVQVLDFRASYMEAEYDSFPFLMPERENPHYIYTAKLDEDMLLAFITLFRHLPRYQPAEDLNPAARAYYMAVLSYFGQYGTPVDIGIGSYEEAEHHMRIKKVCSYIHGHIGEKLSISVLAKEAGYSESHLPRLFRRVLGCTISEYISRVLVNEIYRLAENGTLTTAEISDRLGFSHPNNLGRMYKRVTGESIGELYKRITK